MKLIIAILFLVVYPYRSVSAQKIVSGISRGEVRLMFPHYAKQFTDTNTFGAIDSIPHFLFHGVYGEAFFTFIHGRLHHFRWIYPKAYYWGNHRSTRLLTQKDLQEIAKVIRGLRRDYGAGKELDDRELIWTAPHSVVSSIYSIDDFRFQVVDSADFMLFEHSLN